MNLAQYVASFLKIQGVHRVFGLPGGENVLFLEALREAGVEFILFQHEAAAGFAADITGQLTGVPGICMSTVGPGAVNLAAAAAGATLERSPVLAITADIDSRLKPRVAHMKIEVNELFGAITKGSFQMKPESVKQTLASAWQLAQTHPRGAVHLSVSPDAATAGVEGEPFYLSPPGITSIDETAFELAIPYLEQAADLIIIAGLGVEAAGAQSALLKLAERWRVPVVVTPKAKGHFPEGHPLFVGCYTAYGDDPLRRALDGADIVLGVGLDGVDLVTSTWNVAAPVINLNLAGADDPVIRPRVAIDGDLVEALERMATGVQRPGNVENSIEARAAALRQGIMDELVTDEIATRPGTIRIRRLVAALQASLPDNGAVSVDVGVFKLVFLQQWRADYEKSFFVANGLSAMGYAVPAALALKLEQPDRPVVALVGDGALLMYAGELATVARLDLPLVIVVLVDDALSLIRLKQKRQKVPIQGTEFGPIDYQQMAGAFKIDYRLVDGGLDPGAVLSEALSLNRPVLVEARIDREEYNHFR